MTTPIPDFASLPADAPQPAGQLPQYAPNDPGSEAEAALGKGVQAAGAATEDVSAYQQIAQTKMDIAMANSSFLTSATQLGEQLKTETDPAKVTALGASYQGALANAGAAFSNPATQKLWLAQNQEHVAKGLADAAERNTQIYNDRYGAGILSQLETSAQQGATAIDPIAFPAAQANIASLVQSAQDAGAFTAERGEAVAKAYNQQLVSGRAVNLVNGGDPAAASALLTQHGAGLDPYTVANLQARIEAKSDSIGTDSAAMRALGLAAPLPPGTTQAPGTLRPNSILAGGPIPQAIATTAQARNVDPSLALTTAQIESGFGENLGTRGNIYQLGNPEWAGVGGGTKGDPATDINNGIAFLANTKADLAAKLGRAPDNAEVYLAHQQGVDGAAALLAHPGDTAGRLVPPENISDNGGDPNGTARQFTQQWRNTYAQRAALVAPLVASGGTAPPAAGAGLAPTPTEIAGWQGTGAKTDLASYVTAQRAATAPAAAIPGATPATFDSAGGDSIGVGFIRAAKLGGQAVDSTTMPQAVDADAAGSRNPQQGLDFITAHPANFAGKSVLWSSGLMNAGANPAAALPLVEQQLDALKAAGATNVVLAGVDQGKFAQYNTALAAIAEAHGVPFAGPLPTTDVHPSPQGYRDYAATAAQLLPPPGAAGGDQVVTPPAPGDAAAQPPPAANSGQPGATPPAQSAPAPAQNRTGLPSLAQAYQNIVADPALHTDLARDIAFRKAVTVYEKMEADAALADRLQVQQQATAMKSREDQIYASIYNPAPGAPPITASQIAVDPAFSGNPERRSQMIALVNNPPGSGIPAAQSYAAAGALIQRMRLPAGDPARITDVGPLYDAATGNPAAGIPATINRGDFEFAQKQLDQLSAVGTEKFAQRKAQFIADIGPQIDKTAFSGVPDLKGKSRLYEFGYDLDSKIDQYKKDSKDPNDLLNPAKPDYMGSPATVKPYTRTVEEVMQDFPGAGQNGAPGIDISTPDKLKAAVANGMITRDQGNTEAVRREWATPAPNPIRAVPLAPSVPFMLGPQ